jgi:hypothetical protein
MTRTRHALAFTLVACVLSAPAPHAQVKAQLPATITPPWSTGIQPISRESYWNAVECGKQGGAAPKCVFYDTDLCKNPDFTLALYTPYKQVAYEVWQAVSKKQPAPTPSYQAAQRTRVVIGIRPQRGGQNPLTALTVKRGGKAVPPESKVLDAGGGTFTFDFAAFAPTATVTIEMVGKTGTQTCVIDRATLARMR